MNKSIKPSRVVAMGVLFALIMVIYLAFLYNLQIVQGEEYYNRSKETSTEKRTVTAARGNILDEQQGVLQPEDRHHQALCQ